MRGVKRISGSFLGLIALLALDGCAKAPARNLARLGVPKPDLARIVHTPLENTPSRIRAKWSIIGGRNWESPIADTVSLTLSGGYPLNAPLRRGGCHTWEIDLDAKRVDGRWQWKTTVHGSNGKTAVSQGAAQGLELLLDQDSEQQLPATVPLATVDRKQITIALPR